MITTIVGRRAADARPRCASPADRLAALLRRRPQTTIGDALDSVGPAGLVAAVPVLALRGTPLRGLGGRRVVIADE